MTTTTPSLSASPFPQDFLTGPIAPVRSETEDNPMKRELEELEGLRGAGKVEIREHRGHTFEIGVPVPATYDLAPIKAVPIKDESEPTVKEDCWSRNAVCLRRVGCVAIVVISLLGVHYLYSKLVLNQ